MANQRVYLLRLALGLPCGLHGVLDLLHKVGIAPFAVRKRYVFQTPLRNLETAGGNLRISALEGSEDASLYYRVLKGEPRNRSGCVCEVVWGESCQVEV